MTASNGKCNQCQAPAFFEDSPEGQICRECDDWVCNDCMSWSYSGDEGIICKECVEDIISGKHKPSVPLVNYGSGVD